MAALAGILPRGVPPADHRLTRSRSKLPTQETAIPDRRIAKETWHADVPQDVKHVEAGARPEVHKASVADDLGQGPWGSWQPGRQVQKG